MKLVDGQMVCILDCFFRIFKPYVCLFSIWQQESSGTVTTTTQPAVAPLLSCNPLHDSSTLTAAQQQCLTQVCSVFIADRLIPCMMRPTGVYTLIKVVAKILFPHCSMGDFMTALWMVAQAPPAYFSHDEQVALIYCYKLPMLHQSDTRIIDVFLFERSLPQLFSILNSDRRGQEVSPSVGEVTEQTTPMVEPILSKSLLDDISSQPPKKRYCRFIADNFNQKFPEGEQPPVELLEGSETCAQDLQANGDCSTPCKPGDTLSPDQRGEAPGHMSMAEVHRSFIESMLESAVGDIIKDVAEASMGVDVVEHDITKVKISQKQRWSGNRGISVAEIEEKRLKRMIRNKSSKAKAKFKVGDNNPSFKVTHAGQTSFVVGVEAPPMVLKDADIRSAPKAVEIMDVPKTPEGKGALEVAEVSDISQVTVSKGGFTVAEEPEAAQVTEIAGSAKFTEVGQISKGASIKLVEKDASTTRTGASTRASEATKVDGCTHRKLQKGIHKAGGKPDMKTQVAEMHKSPLQRKFWATSSPQDTTGDFLMEGQTLITMNGHVNNINDRLSKNLIVSTHQTTQTGQEPLTASMDGDCPDESDTNNNKRESPSDGSATDFDHPMLRTILLQDPLNTDSNSEHVVNVPECGNIAGRSYPATCVPTRRMRLDDTKVTIESGSKHSDMKLRSLGKITERVNSNGAIDVTSGGPEPGKSRRWNNHVAMKDMKDWLDSMKRKLAKPLVSDCSG